MKISKIAKTIAILFLFAISNYSQTSETIQSGKFKMTFNNNGIFSDVMVKGIVGAQYDTTKIIFSNGFLLTGVYGDSIWTNSEFTSERMEDYLPGTFQTADNDSLNVIYKVTASDKPFGSSWQKYKGAVKQGADFYDGNKNGIYDPEDFNNNGKWDLDEDRPSLIGDETFVFTYHDGVESKKRAFHDQKPVGVEITNYVYKFSGDENLDNIIFIRYQIKNNGMFHSSFDSVYFAIAVDPDINNYSDDLFGTDTLINSGFAFSNNNDNKDESYSLISQFIQQPIIKSIDPNSIAYDYALPDIVNTIHGYKNQIMNSLIMLNVYPGLFIDNASVRRNWCKFGRYTDTQIDVCTWHYGEVLNENCSDIHSCYMYSGDPIYLKGWIDDDPRDIKYYQTTGQFILEENKPQNIIVAYMVGTGAVPLEAVKNVKMKARWLQTYYPFVYNGEYFKQQNNIDSTNTEEINYDFVLYQNYPNPFNPVTTIKFNIEGHSTSASDQSESVTLKIFDILGREVQTLLDEKLSPGIHEVNFDGSKLSSGVYFYSLRQGAKFTQKKMLLLK